MVAVIRNFVTVYIDHIKLLPKKHSFFQKRSLIVQKPKKKLILSHFGCPERKFCFIRPGINKNQLNRLERNKKDDKINILYIGMLREQKGVQFIIKTLKYLQIAKEYHFYVTSSGNFQHYLQKLA